MDSLYQEILHRHMQAAGLEPRSGETLEDTAERGIRIRSQRLLCDKLEARMLKEDQFNRKVEINAELRHAKSLLQGLLGNGPA
jgi:pimeloyl-CoA synthetase